MPAKKKGSGRKYGKAAGKTVASAMRRKKKGTLKSGKGGKGGTVKSRKQAIAIGLSEARKKGAEVPEEEEQLGPSSALPAKAVGRSALLRALFFGDVLHRGWAVTASAERNGSRA